MMPCTRPEIPTVLKENQKKWSSAYQIRRSKDEGAEFFWPEINKTPLNQHLLPALKQMTDEHCAYCDGYPLDTICTPTIDHFQPKSKFPELAFTWDNLFLCCQFCQGSEGKADSWNADALKPDQADYQFEKYFYYEYETGRLHPNSSATPDDQHRAEATIKLMGLNKGGRPEARKRDLKRPKEDRTYRFLPG
jgi:uncharacterized protein (TIGR02646 family)